MRKLIFACFLAFCALSARSQSPGVHLSGTITDLTGTPVAGTVTFVLGNYASNPPIITGYSELAPLSTTVTANNSGAWAAVIYGEDQINPINTTYTVTIMLPGSSVASWTAEYVIKSGSYDLSTLTPIHASIPPRFIPAAGPVGATGPAGATGAT